MNKAPLIYLAPFQGITGSVFREIYARHFPAVDKYFTPFFTNIHKHKSFERKSREIENTHHHRIPVVPQILSNDATEIIRFANYCQELGFQEINWNLGCPFPRVAMKKRGSGLLPHPSLISKILSEVIPQISISLSVKCRLGYESPDEILDLIPIFQNHDINELIVHARTGRQIYKGEVNLDVFEQLIPMTQLILVYNGDVFNEENFQSYSDRFPSVNRWMIGRGILADPFLAGDIKGMDLPHENRYLYIRKFVEDLYIAYRKDKNDSLHTIGLMKELWEYLSFSFDKPVRVFSLVKKTKSFDDYEDAVHRIFENYQWLGSSDGSFNSDSI